MAIYKNENGTLSRKDASAASQIGAIDTENILGGGAGAQTNTQALLDALAEGGGGGGGLPAGGSADDMLVKNSASAGDASWKTPAQVKTILGVDDGHTIQNASGTDMTARAGLQFKSGKVSDDSVNDRTVVEQVVPLTEAQYQALPSSKNSDNTFYFTTDGVTQPLPSLGYTPVGTIISVMGTSAPTNFLACNGQTVNIADYPVLANYFLAQFGQINKFGGDGTTTFGIPDLRGEFLRGTGTNGHTNQGNGAAVGTHQDATAVPYMEVYANDNYNVVQMTGDTTGRVILSQYDSAYLATSGTTVKYAKANAEQGSTGLTSNLRTIRPTNTSVLFCIAVRDIYIGKDSALAGRVDAINERFNYSTAEKVVGKWIDGRPLYRRTFYPNETITVTSSSAVSGNIVLFNLDGTIVNGSGMFVQQGGRGYEQIFPYWSHKGDGTILWQMSINRTQDNGDVNVYYNFVAQDRVCVVKYVTVEYVKTADL